MIKTLLQNSKRIAILAFCAFLAMQMFAKWEQVLDFKFTQAVFVTEKGTLLTSNYDLDFLGGIKYSTDQGNTWEDAIVDDYCFSFFTESDGVIYATGMCAMIAKSTDDGRTWKCLDYSDAAAPYAPKGKTINCASYGVTVLGNRVYITDTMAGVLYTEDEGNTWKVTDRKSITYKDDSGEYIEYFYNLNVINGELYGFGLYNVFKYDEEADKWQFVRSSNALAVNTYYKDKLVCGRSIQNDTENTDFLLYTEDGTEWLPVKRPKNFIDNYVRAISSDDSMLYVGVLTKGMLYTSDFGENWSFCQDGLPTTTWGYETLLMLANDDKYVYAAIFIDSERTNKSGVYRVAKSELASGVGAIQADNEATVTFSDNVLTINGDFCQASIVDVAGKTVKTITASHTDLSHLSSGLYICILNDANGKSQSIKFVK